MLSPCTGGAADQQPLRAEAASGRKAGDNRSVKDRILSRLFKKEKQGERA